MREFELTNLGEQLYDIYRNSHTEGYPINRKFIDNLDAKSEKELMASFINARKQFESNVDENNHIETFWGMYDELQ